jgi:hemerythrin-like domain-containing protein
MNQFFQMLKKDHAKVKVILGQLKETMKSAPKKREALFQKLRAELVPHMKAEEKKVFKRTEKALGHDEIQNIMKQFELEKQKVKKSLK